MHASCIHTYIHTYIFLHTCLYKVVLAYPASGVLLVLVFSFSLGLGYDFSYGAGLDWTGLDWTGLGESCSRFGWRRSKCPREGEREEV